MPPCAALASLGAGDALLSSRTVIGFHRLSAWPNQYITNYITNTCLQSAVLCCSATFLKAGCAREGMEDQREVARPTRRRFLFNHEPGPRSLPERAERRITAPKPLRPTSLRGGLQFKQTGRKPNLASPPTYRPRIGRCAANTRIIRVLGSAGSRIVQH